MTARANQSLGAAIASADLVIPDGAGVVWALSRQGVRVVRSPGIELAWTLLSYAAAHRWSVALIGASPDVMKTLQVTLRERFPDLRLTLCVDGYRPDPDWPAIEQELRSSDPDLVLVALGVPRQETWAQRVSAGCNGLWMGVGGSFDVWAGAKKERPSGWDAFRSNGCTDSCRSRRWRRMLAIPFMWAVWRSDQR